LGRPASTRRSGASDALPPGIAGGVDDPDRLFLATLRIRVPSGLWAGHFTQIHPRVRVEVLNRGEVRPGVSISDHWISAGPPGAWVEEISRYPDIEKVEALAEVGGGSLYRVTYRNPPILGLYRRLQLPVPFPLRIQGGMIDWEVAARYSDFETILAFARQRDPRARVISIRRRALRNHLPQLTERQHELLTDAMAAGYFAVPRGITLTALARKLHRSKSSVSEAIALVEQKLLESALRSPSALG
jgi:hypothetical protein